MLTIGKIKSMWGKKIKVVLSDGLVFAGILTGFYDKYDTSSGHDEIELDMGKSFLDIEIDDVVSAELIG